VKVLVFTGKKCARLEAPVCEQNDAMGRLRRNSVLARGDAATDIPGPGIASARPGILSELAAGNQKLS